MAKMNFLLSLNSYLDANSSNNPSLNVIKWARDFQGMSVEKPQSLQFSLAPGESRTLFDGTRTLLQDGTTQYQLALKAGTSSTYVLKHVGGTAPQFRTARSTGADATTQVTVTKNGNVVTFESTVGTLFDLITGGVVVGDKVNVGNLFASGNQGTFTVIARNATSFSVENANGTAEGPVTLGSGFADQVRIYSAAGVQAGDTINIFGGFSLATQGSYEVTAAQDNQVEFYSTSSLPAETITTDSVNIYSDAKRMIYLESDKKLAVSVNDASQGQVEPLVSGNEVKPGMLLKSETVWSFSVTNNSLDTATVYFASVE
jgi:hypothetical protein